MVNNFTNKNQIDNHGYWSVLIHKCKFQWISLKKNTLLNQLFLIVIDSWSE